MTYGDYLRSDWWKKKRLHIYHKGKRHCYLCHKRGKNEVFHVHHLRYHRDGESILGKEEDRDLKLLCKPCHDTLHENGIEAYLYNCKMRRTELRDWVKRLRREKR